MARELLSDPIIQRITQTTLSLETLNGEDEIEREKQRVATVLMPLVKRNKEWRMILTQRPDTMPSHPGQIAFPGGKREFGETTLNAALRETEEEIGVMRQDITVISRLPSFNIKVSNFRVTPFIAIINEKVPIIPEENEVADVFEVPFGFLMDGKNYEHKQREYMGKKYDVVYMPYTCENNIYRNIWGVTANTIYHLYQRAFENA